MVPLCAFNESEGSTQSLPNDSTGLNGRIAFYVYSCRVISFPLSPFRGLGFQKASTSFPQTFCLSNSTLTKVLPTASYVSKTVSKRQLGLSASPFLVPVRINVGRKKEAGWRKNPAKAYSPPTVALSCPPRRDTQLDHVSLARVSQGAWCLHPLQHNEVEIQLKDPRRPQR